jgi:hypothetical protein
MHRFAPALADRYGRANAPVVYDWDNGTVAEFYSTFDRDRWLSAPSATTFERDVHYNIRMEG